MCIVAATRLTFYYFQPRPFSIQPKMDSGSVCRLTVIDELRGKSLSVKGLIRFGYSTWEEVGQNHMDRMTISISQCNTAVSPVH